MHAGDHEILTSRRGRRRKTPAPTKPMHSLNRLVPDTDKQQRLAWHLAKAGHPAGWRPWIREQRAIGLSAQRIAYLIRDVAGMTVDQSTVNLWIKQAETPAPLPEAQK